MHALEKMFPSLTLFSDLNWSEVTAEYEANYIDISFPEYLQQKAEEGDCPPYLFELAFFEMAHSEVKNSQELFPHLPGVYLNPTALFLSLEFDIKRMLNEAKKGVIDVFEKSHVLCLYRDQHDAVHIIEVSEEELDLLQHLEEGPMENFDFVTTEQSHVLKKMTQAGLILDQVTT